MTDTPIKQILEMQIAINMELNESITVLIYTIREMSKVLTRNQQEALNSVLTTRMKTILNSDNISITNNIGKQKRFILVVDK